MSERPTPETDAEIYPMNGVDIVWPEFSRQLERERDEAREAAAKWESSSDAMERAGAEQARRADENREWALRAERERDEARAELADHKSALEIANRSADDQMRQKRLAERERDEAREQNAKLRDIAERAIELALAYYDGPCERDGAKLRLELDQLKEGGK